MKILFYNLGYGRGHDGSVREYILKAYRFFHCTKKVQRGVLNKVIDVWNNEQPDVFAYAEVALGSFRNQGLDQHRFLVENLPRGSVADAALSKYGESALTIAPFHIGNANGVITHVPAKITEHYLQNSRKKLVFKIELERLTVFAVHLPLVSNDRVAQLLELSTMVNDTKGDVVVCGDFNIFDGVDELKVITNCTELTVVGRGMRTFPAYAPRLLLDVFLYRFSDVKMTPTMRVLNVQGSDHLPVVLEWH